MESLHYEDNYDMVNLAGASLGVVGSDDPRKVAGEMGDTHSALFHDIDSHWDVTFFDQVTVSANLHAIDRVVVIDHLGCSCYNEYYSDYGSAYHGDAGKSAVEHHFTSMRLFCELVNRVYGGAGTHVSGYLLDEDGTPVKGGEVRYAPKVKGTSVPADVSSQLLFAPTVDQGHVMSEKGGAATVRSGLADYANSYRAARDAYLKAANELKKATGPYKAAREAHVANIATYTKSLYE
jgi:hypothetical protein